MLATVNGEKITLNQVNKSEAKNIAQNVQHTDGTVEPRKPVGVDWPRCLPGVYWANYFGKPYIEWFGRKELLSAPAYETRELPSGTIRLIAYARPTDAGGLDGVEVEDRIRTHLGLEAFFDRRAEKRRVIAPEQDYSELRVRSE